MKSAYTLTLEIVKEFLLAEKDSQFDLHQKRAEAHLESYVREHITRAVVKPSEDEFDRLYAED